MPPIGKSTHAAPALEVGAPASEHDFGSATALTAAQRISARIASDQKEKDEAAKRKSIAAAQRITDRIEALNSGSPPSSPGVQAALEKPTARYAALGIRATAKVPVTKVRGQRMTNGEVGVPTAQWPKKSRLMTHAKEHHPPIRSKKYELPVVQYAKESTENMTRGASRKSPFFIRTTDLLEPKKPPRFAGDVVKYSHSYGLLNVARPNGDLRTGIYTGRSGIKDFHKKFRQDQEAKKQKDSH